MKIGLISLGCARTLVDSEVALGSLKKAGHEIVSNAEWADVAIVNTCSFIEDAKKESIDTILRLCKLKKEGRLSAVIVLGCLAQRYGPELKKEIGELDGIIGTDSYEALPALLEKLPAKKRKIFEVKDKPKYLLDENSPRYTLTPSHYAYIKVSEGCINACAYCAIPKMKGPHRSRPVESILAEVQKLSHERKLSEINLIGQDAAAFGYDRGRVFELPNLLRELDRQKLVPWVRLLYAHPGHVTEALVDAMADSPAICRYVDFPIEHSHDDVLRRMNRGVTREKMEWGIRVLRKKMPDIAIRTTVIVGFPGETEEEFDDLMKFIRDIRFERLGAFMFSREEGTRAYDMPDQVSNYTKRERFEAVMTLQAEISAEICACFVGKTLRVLVDEKDPYGEHLFHGRSQADAPEVDGDVLVHSQKELKPGDFVDVKITESLEYDLVGTVLL